MNNKWQTLVFWTGVTGVTFVYPNPNLDLPSSVIVRARVVLAVAQPYRNPGTVASRQTFSAPVALAPIELPYACYGSHSLAENNVNACFDARGISIIPLHVMEVASPPMKGRRLPD